MWFLVLIMKLNSRVFWDFWLCFEDCLVFVRKKWEKEGWYGFGSVLGGQNGWCFGALIWGVIWLWLLIYEGNVGAFCVLYTVFVTLEGLVITAVMGFG